MVFLVYNFYITDQDLRMDVADSGRQKREVLSTSTEQKVDLRKVLSNAMRGSPGVQGPPGPPGLTVNVIT